MARITLKYDLNVGSQSAFATKLLDRAKSIDVDQGSLDYIGMSIVDDQTAPDLHAKNKIIRVITLATNALGDSIWQNADQLKYATRNIFKEIFEQRMPALVTAEEPVVS